MIRLEHMILSSRGRAFRRIVESNDPVDEDTLAWGEATECARIADQSRRAATPRFNNLTESKAGIEKVGGGGLLETLNMLYEPKNHDCTKTCCVR